MAGGFDVDRKLDLGGRLDGKIRRLRAAKDLLDEPRGLSTLVVHVGPVGDEPAGLHPERTHEDRGHPVAELDVEDDARDVEARARRGEQRVARLHPAQRAHQLFRGADPAVQQLEPQARCHLRALPRRRARRQIVGVVHRPHPSYRRHERLECLEALGDQLGDHARHARDVAARAVERSNNPRRDRITDVREDDGNGRGRLSRGERHLFALGDDHVDAHLHQRARFRKSRFRLPA